MTDELEKAQRAYDDACRIWEDAQRAFKEAVRKRDDAKYALVQAKLRVAGIVPLKTRVEYTGFFGGSGPFFVECVTHPSRIILCKIKKDGTPGEVATGGYGSVSVDDLRVIQ